MAKDEADKLKELVQATDGGIAAFKNEKNNTQMLYDKVKFVHVLPHSHTDLGWLSTVDEYFDGKNLGFYQGSVDEILTSTIEQLE